MDEMFSPLSNAILPASIEERLKLYECRNTLEENRTNYKIIKHKFLNYRQFSMKLIEGKKQNIEAYALSYSTLPRKRAQGKVEFKIQELYYLNREEVKFITLEYFNTLSEKSYTSIIELIYSPPSFEEELEIRRNLLNTDYDLTPIIVVNEISQKKLTLFLDAKIYEDTKEKLIIL